MISGGHVERVRRKSGPSYSAPDLPRSSLLQQEGYEIGSSLTNTSQESGNPCLLISVKGMLVII